MSADHDLVRAATLADMKIIAEAGDRMLARHGWTPSPTHPGIYLDDSGCGAPFTRLRALTIVTWDALGRQPALLGNV